MTQTQRIIELSREEGWVDQLMALREAGCMRLASRISDIRRLGLPVEKRTKKVLNRWGEERYVAEYKVGEISEGTV